MFQYYILQLLFVYGAQQVGVLLSSTHTLHKGYFQNNNLSFPLNEQQ